MLSLVAFVRLARQFCKTLYPEGSHYIHITKPRTDRITNTAPSPIYLSTINGAATSLGCLARTLGPAVSGMLFRLGLDVGSAGLAFWALGAVAGLGLVVSFTLR